MLKKMGDKRERLYKTGNSWKGSNKRRENIQREDYSSFLWFFHKHAILGNNANVAGFIHCLTFSFCHSINQKLMEIFFTVHRNKYR